MSIHAHGGLGESCTKSFYVFTRTRFLFAFFCFESTQRFTQQIKVGIPSFKKATDSVPTHSFHFLEKFGRMCTVSSSYNGPKRAKQRLS